MLRVSSSVRWTFNQFATLLSESIFAASGWPVSIKTFLCGSESCEVVAGNYYTEKMNFVDHDDSSLFAFLGSFTWGLSIQWQSNLGQLTAGLTNLTTIRITFTHSSTKLSITILEITFSFHLHKHTYLVIGNKKAYSGFDKWIKHDLLTINNPIFLAKLISAQFRIATEIQAFQTILKSPIPWISWKNYEMPSSAKRYLDESCSGIKNRQRIGVILTPIISTACLKLTSRRFFDK